MWTTAANLCSSSWFDSNFFSKMPKNTWCVASHVAVKVIFWADVLCKKYTQSGIESSRILLDLFKIQKVKRFVFFFFRLTFYCVFTLLFSVSFSQKNCGLKSGQDHLYVWIFVLKQMKKPNLYLRFHYFALFLLSNQRTSFNEDENHKSLFKNVTKPCVTF